MGPWPSLAYWVKIFPATNLPFKWGPRLQFNTVLLGTTQCTDHTMVERVTIGRIVFWPPNLPFS